MSSSNAPNSDPPRATLDAYTPVSGLAVAALAISILAVILIGGIAVAARVSGMPAYQPFLMLPAAIGFVLAIAARWSVKHMQGARTGAGFATVALWLSGLGGACYAAYMVTTELAIRSQAREFTEQWVKKIANAPLEQSFLWALDPSQRPSDETDLTAIRDRFGPMFYTYRDHKVVRLIREAGKDIEVRSRGIKGWEYTAAGSFVQQHFDIHTREGVFQCVISVLGQDRPTLGGRVWQVLLNKTEVQDWNTTEYGRILLDSQFASGKFIREWADKINREQLESAFRDTLPLADRSRVKEIVKTPAYEEFLAGSLIRVDGQNPTPEQRQKYGKVLLEPIGINPLPGSAESPVGAPRVEFVNDSLRTTSMIELNVELNRPVVAYVALDVVGEELIGRLKELRAMDWRKLPILPAPTQFDASIATDRFADHGFRVVSVDVQPRAARIVAPRP
jgi:hypothetical protein